MSEGIDRRLAEAYAQHRRNALDAAAALYRGVLDESPRHPYALHMLGVIRYQQGDVPAAIDLLRKAVAAAPGDAAARSNLGLALLAAGDAPEALRRFDEALALAPAYPEASNNRGNALCVLGRHAEAIASYERALALRDDADPWYNRGRALQAIGRLTEAIESFERALARAPDRRDALRHAAALLRRLARHDEAVACHDRLVALDPGSAPAHNDRGNALLAAGRDDEALAAYERALAIDGALVEAHSNRSIVLHRLGRLEDALAACDAALRNDPGFASALVNRGHVLQDLRRPDEALACFERAIGLDPSLADAHDGLGKILQARRRYAAALECHDRALALDAAHTGALTNRVEALWRMRRYEEAVAALDRLLAVDPGFEFGPGARLQGRLRCCQWEGLDEAAAQIAEGVRRGERVVHPFFFLATCDDSADQRRCAEIYAQALGMSAHAPLARGERYGHDRIRVALMSGDFHEHATAYLVAELVEIHDRTRFEIVAVSWGPDDGGPTRARLRAAFDEFADVSAMSDDEVAGWMRAREIDVAVDLKGYTEGARPGILARRPASVQVGYLGFPGTLGTAALDYLVADRFVVPPGDEPFFAERVVRMPDSYQANDRRRAIAAAAPSRTELSLPAGAFVFGSFNNNWKISPPVFAAWMRVLRSVDGSVLWLLEDNPAAARNLRREAQRRGVDPQRLVFAPRAAPAAHLARQRHADLLLDTLPCNGHTTTSDALWAGVPLLTVSGRTFAGRVGASLLHAAGLPELVATGMDEYEETAIRLATRPRELAELRERLTRGRDGCALFDTARFRGHLEAAYAQMLDRHRAGLAPRSFDVSAGLRIAERAT